MNRYAPFHGIIPLCPVERGTEDNATGTTTLARVRFHHFIFYTAMLFMICLHTPLPIFNVDFAYEPPSLYKIILFLISFQQFPYNRFYINLTDIKLLQGIDHNLIFFFDCSLGVQNENVFPFDTTESSGTR